MALQICTKNVNITFHTHIELQGQQVRQNASLEMIKSKCRYAYIQRLIPCSDIEGEIYIASQTLLNISLSFSCDGLYSPSSRPNYYGL